MSSWQRWCEESQRRELSANLTKLNIVSAFVISSYAFASLVGAFFWWRWFKLTSASKAQFWPGFKWYTALMSIGCLFGFLHYTCDHNAATYFFRMQSSGGFAGADQAGTSDADKIVQAEMLAYSAYWWAGTVIFRSLEQCLLTLASLQILEHMVGKIFEAEIAGAKRLLLKRFLIGAQIILLPINILTVGFMTVSGIYNVRGADQYLQSAATRRTGDNTTADVTLQTATDTNNLSNTYEGYASYLRVIISVALVVVFVAFGAYVWRMLRRAQQLLGMVKLQIRGTYNNSVADIAMDAGRAMQRRVERTVVVVFLTFLFAAIYACMWAFCFSGFNLLPECGECGECQNVATVMSMWFMFNPEVRMLASFASAPAALLLAMYGMIGQHERHTLFPARLSTAIQRPNTASRRLHSDAAA